MIALVSPFPTSRNTWCCRLSPRRHSRMNTTRPSQCEDSSHSSPFWEASNFIEFWKNFRTRRHIDYVKMCWNMKESHEKALIRQKHVLCESCWHDSPWCVYSGRRINCYVRVPFFVADEKDLSNCITEMFASGTCNRPCNMCILKFKAGAGESEPSITEKGSWRVLSEMRKVLLPQNDEFNLTCPFLVVDLKWSAVNISNFQRVVHSPGNQPSLQLTGIRSF